MSLITDQTPIDPTVAPAADPTPAPAPAPEGDAPAAAAARPDHIPEKFWDAEKAELRADALLKSYTELEKRQAATPTAPETYSRAIPEDLREALGGIAEIPDTDPLYVSASAAAKEAGLSDEAFTGLVSAYLKTELEMEQQRLNEERAALGKDGEQRLVALNSWAKVNLQPEQEKIFRGLARSADAVAVLEAIVKRAGYQPAPPTAGATPLEGLTPDKLSDMMKDERYWNPQAKGSVEYRKQVEEGFRRLYPDGKTTS